MIGWGSEDSRDYWIIRNFWGSSWGESGLMRIQMGKNSRELFIKNYTLEKVVSQTFELYDNIYQ